jgi:hypothetical protein
MYVLSLEMRLGIWKVGKQVQPSKKSRVLKILRKNSAATPKIKFRKKLSGFLKYPMLLYCIER